MTTTFPFDIRDLDVSILLEMDLKTLNHTCRANTYLASICQDENFWRLKVQRDFYVTDKPKDITWKQFYKESILDLDEESLEETIKLAYLLEHSFVFPTLFLLTNLLKMLAAKLGIVSGEDFINNLPCDSKYKRHLLRIFRETGKPRRRNALFLKLLRSRINPDSKGKIHLLVFILQIIIIAATKVRTKDEASTIWPETIEAAIQKSRFLKCIFGKVDFKTSIENSVSYNTI